MIPEPNHYPEPYKEGWEASRMDTHGHIRVRGLHSGEPEPAENPYTEGTEEYDQWLKGYTDFIPF